MEETLGILLERARDFFDAGEYVEALIERKMGMVEFFDEAV